jgi:hypothetical protein
MAGIEIRSVEGLAGTAVPYAYAVKAGPWLFLTGHEAFDFGRGGRSGGLSLVRRATPKA